MLKNTRRKVANPTPARKTPGPGRNALRQFWAVVSRHDARWGASNSVRPCFPVLLSGVCYLCGGLSAFNLRMVPSFNPQTLPAGRQWRQLASLLALVPLLAACGHDLPKQLPGFDAAAWARDPYACQNQRAAQLPALLAVREQLYEARANSINQLLGHPDEEELRAQTEKVYYYYLAPGTQCEPAHRRSAAPKLSLRFGPLGTVTEILADPLPAQP